MSNGHTPARSGRYVKAIPVRSGERDFDVAVDSTLRAALLHQEGAFSGFSVTPSDLRKKVFRRPCRHLTVFVVDASESMGRGTFIRMKAAKGAALAILAKSRLGRHRIAMVGFWDEFAEVILQPTSSLTLARERLKTLPTGGATPFADGLVKAWKIVKTERIKDPEIQPLLVIISDGEANVPYGGRRYMTKVREELLAIADRIGRDRIHSIAIDTRPAWAGPGDMQRVADALGGTYHLIDGVQAGNVVDAISTFT